MILGAVLVGASDDEDDGEMYNTAFCAGCQSLRDTGRIQLRSVNCTPYTTEPSSVAPVGSSATSPLTSVGPVDRSTTPFSSSVVSDSSPRARGSISTVMKLVRSEMRHQRWRRELNSSGRTGSSGSLLTTDGVPGMAIADDDAITVARRLSAQFDDEVTDASTWQPDTDYAMPLSCHHEREDERLSQHLFHPLATAVPWVSSDSTA